MNPLLNILVQLAIHLVETEGPVALQWIEGEMDNLKKKYPDPGVKVQTHTDLGAGNH